MKRRSKKMQAVVDAFMDIILQVADADFKRGRAGYETITERSERLGRRDKKGRWIK